MKKETKIFIILGGINAALAVILGAVAAHSLKATLTPKLLITFKTGTLYHLFHSIGLFAVAFVSTLVPSSRLVKLSGWLMVTGIALFSLSLYVLALSEVHWFGVLTPIGGLSFITSWLLLAVAVLKKKPS